MKNIIRGYIYKTKQKGRRSGIVHPQNFLDGVYQMTSTPIFLCFEKEERC